MDSKLRDDCANSGSRSYIDDPEFFTSGVLAHSELKSVARQKCLRSLSSADYFASSVTRIAILCGQLIPSLSSTSRWAPVGLLDDGGISSGRR